MNLGERLLGAVINPVVEAVDVDGVVSKVDVARVLDEVDVDALVSRVDADALLARVDVDAVLERIDVPALLARVDVDRLTERIDVQSLVDRVDIQSIVDRVDADALVSRIDVDALMGRVDVDALVARVDVETLLAKVDPNTLLAKIDVDALLDRVDVAAVARRAGIDDIVSEATVGVTAKVLAAARRQVVALDLVVTGVWAHLTRRPRPQPPAGPTATGLDAGPVSRLLAYFVDVAALSVGFSLLTSLAIYLVQLFSGDRVDGGARSWGWPYAVGYAAFAALYWLVGLTVAGSSIGKALVGLRVTNLEGRPLRGRQALVRVIVYPFSFILGLGLLPILTARSHRALHDKAAHTRVRYDWGDGEVSSYSPLAAWLRGRPAGTWAAEQAAAGPLPRRRPPA